MQKINELGFSDNTVKIWSLRRLELSRLLEKEMWQAEK